MLSNILSILLLSSLVAIGYVWYKRTNVEGVVFAVITVTAFVAMMVVAGIATRNGFDTEILNSQVTKKYSEKVSCRHDYRCNCKMVTRKRSDGTTYEAEECDTCYEHEYDVSWRLDTGLGRITIERVDRQGLKEPNRWTVAKVGDPVADTHMHFNHIKAAPDSILNEGSNTILLERYKHFLLPYPNKIYDYHYVNRVLGQGVNIPEIERWNLELANMLRVTGPSKEVNVVIVFTSQPSSEYALALRAHWLGGKKNDVVVVVGISQWPNIAWSNVFSWSEREMFKLSIRDAIAELKVVDRQQILNVIHSEIVKGYVRPPMREKSYLSERNGIDAMSLITIILVMFSIQIGTIIYVHKGIK